MARITDIASVIRSKNSGPYELTFDIIFKSKEIYKKVKENKVISSDLICKLYNISIDKIINIVEFDPANAIKITIIRPIVSGDIGETDIYGAQQHAPLLDIFVNID